MNQAVRVVALLQAREGRAAEVERLLLACVQPSRAEDGCLSYVLHRSLDEAGRFVFVERWAHRDAIERHRRMPHYRAMADAVADLLADRQELPAASLSPVDPEPTSPHEE
ncbi:antibiotic biosynthesis monooxygenase [Pseudomonas aeruginosa PGPR2]|nr:antibiotic biosynthesis monooxygenase [Pseudomonas aeruginosa PGPR2]